MDPKIYEGSPSAADPQPKRARRSKETYDLLKAFYANYPKPTKEQKAEICRRISIQEGRPYTERQLTQYLNNKNATKRVEDAKKQYVVNVQAGPSTNRGTSSNETSPFVAGCDARFPSLNAESITHLESLSAPLPEPPMETIQTWASLLKVSPYDIVAWLAARRMEHPNNNAHLPTPSYSTSPEPLSAVSTSSFGRHASASLKSEPAQSPIISSYPLTISLPPPTVNSRSPVVPPMAPPPSFPAVVRDALARVEKQPEPLPPPQTPEEFDTRFAPYLEKMKYFLKATSSSSKVP